MAERDRERLDKEARNRIDKVMCGEGELHVCLCIYAHTWTHTWTHAWACADRHAGMCIYIHLYMYIYIQERGREREREAEEKRVRNTQGGAHLGELDGFASHWLGCY